MKSWYRSPELSYLRHVARWRDTVRTPNLVSGRRLFRYPPWWVVDLAGRLRRGIGRLSARHPRLGIAARGPRHPPDSPARISGGLTTVRNDLGLGNSAKGVTVRYPNHPMGVGTALGQLKRDL